MCVYSSSVHLVMKDFEELAVQDAESVLSGKDGVADNVERVVVRRRLTDDSTWTHCEKSGSGSST